MGMAASQARFLSLTARKSNTEYQGQQVNQQRSVLANESAGLYNRMMALTVPTAPSVGSFYTTSYTFKNGTSDKYTITSISRNIPGFANGYYDVKLDYEEEAIFVDFSKDASPEFAASYVKSEDDDGNLTHEIKIGEQSYELTTVIDPNIVNVFKTESENEDTKLDDSFKGDSAIYSFKVDDKTYYVNEKQLSNMKENGGNIQAYQLKSEMITQEGNAVVSFEKNEATGRYIKLIVQSSEDTKLEEKDVCTLSLTSVKDEEAYEQAMLDYEYDKNIYDKTIEDITSKTKSLQAKDKSLELKLKQLDTEQNAIQTEMEAVQKVIEKNVEDTFKTFG